MIDQERKEAMNKKGYIPFNKIKGLDTEQPKKVHTPKQQRKKEQTVKGFAA